MKTVKFNNGCECPIIGLGTYRSQDEDGYRAVKHAIDVGYRHIDTALYYQNEKEIGRAVSEKIADGIIRREDIFLTSKLWNTFHRPDLVEPALKETLKDLRTDYVDLYLIHWPTAFQDGWNLSPKDQKGKMQFSNVDYVDTWKAMECLVDKGMAKSIGLSNFNECQIERILSCARIVPVNNQIEVHPYLNQKTLVDFCNSKNITVTAYRPLGGPPSESSSPIHNPCIAAIGEKHGKTPGQIMIKFLIERGIIAIPKSSNPQRIESNLDVFDFKLDETDMKTLWDLDKGNQGRSITYDVAIDHKDYPFHSNVEQI
uniref:1,5-anhydro-D-fructose reductase n=2 Tax=Lygus hesperus TaxID=30085 RepID=A0A0A9Y8X7_LYGHE